MVLSCGASAAAATPYPVTLQFIGYPSIVTVGDWTFLNVTGSSEFFNLDVVIFAVWKGANGGTIVAVETGAASVAQGQTANFYVPVFDVGAGSYLVTYFGVTVNNVPVTLALQVQVTLG